MQHGGPAASMSNELIAVLVAGDELHLLHVAPQPTDKHVFMGMYVPPDDGAEEQEVGLGTIALQETPGVGFLPKFDWRQ